MIISFNRHTGEIISLSKTADTFNNKVIEIAPVEITKYEEIVDDEVNIPKTDYFGNQLYKYDGNETSLVVGESNISKGNEVITDGDITIYDNTNLQVNELDKISISNMLASYFKFPEEYKKFNIDEIMEEHYKNILEKSDSMYIIADNFSALNNILIVDSKFKSINKREIILGPGNELKLKSVTLLEPSNIFKILELSSDIILKINDVVVDSVIEFKTPVDKLNISFANNTKNDLILDNFAIGYSLSGRR